MKEYSQCLLYCSISEHSTYSCRQETAKVVREVPTNQSLQTTTTNQLHYPCSDPCSSSTTAHFHHMEQTRSLFKPHPLLPHGNASYYSRIILNSLPLLLFSELFRHNYLRPNRHLALSIPSIKLENAWHALCTFVASNAVILFLSVTGQLQI